MQSSTAPTTRLPNPTSGSIFAFRKCAATKGHTTSILNSSILPISLLSPISSKLLSLTLIKIFQANGQALKSTLHLSLKPSCPKKPAALVPIWLNSKRLLLPAKWMPITLAKPLTALCKLKPLSNRFFKRLKIRPSPPFYPTLSPTWISSTKNSATSTILSMISQQKYPPNKGVFFILLALRPRNYVALNHALHLHLIARYR